MFRFQTQTAQDASGASIRGGLRPQSALGQQPTFELKEAAN